MFERFLATFRPGSIPDTPSLQRPDGVVSGPGDFIAIWGGCTFEEGLYRLHTAPSAAIANRWVADAFSDYADRASCFGYDWLGRQFALDSARTDRAEPLVLMFEPGTGEVLEIPASFAGFHDSELVDHTEDALAREFFREWAEASPESLPLSPTECVGYRVPLFLGGEDVLANLELTDLDVYWTLCGQLLQGSRGLAPGSGVHVTTSDE